MPGLKLWIDDNGILHSEDGGPRVVVKLLPEALTQTRITPWNVIRHSESGTPLTPWQRLWSYWARPDIKIEAHCIIEMDGTIVQACPFIRCADNNNRANKWFAGNEWRGAISYETQDLGSASINSTPWSHEQLESISQLDAALSTKYGIPVRPPVRWDDRGFEGHYRFPEWSIYVGKTCPGLVRRGQFGQITARIDELLRKEEPMFPPFIPEEGKWGMFPAVPRNLRPILSTDLKDLDPGWVKYVQGVLRLKCDAPYVPLDGRYETITAAGVLHGQAFFRNGDDTAKWGVVGERDWEWIDIAAASPAG